METIDFQTSPDRYVISIDKRALDADTLLKALDWLRLEGLAKKAAIDDSIMPLADEIKSTWWQQNRQRFLPKSL